MLKTVFLALGVVALPLVGAAHPRYAGETVFSSNTYGEPSALVVSLSRSLKHHPNAKRFIGDWGMALTRGSQSGTLIYDQEKQVLWMQYSSFTYVDFVNNFYTYAEEKSQQWRFSRVTPNRLRLLFAKYSNKTAFEESYSAAAFEVSFFPRLREFGCHGGLIKRTYQYWNRRKGRN